MPPISHTLADACCNVAALVHRGLRPVARPFVRFGRLASLRSRCTGTIPITTQFDGPVRTALRPHVEFGPHCRLGAGLFLETRDAGVIKLAEHVRLNMGCVLVSYARIEIGAHSLFGEYVSIRDANHGTAPNNPIRLQDHTAAPVRIGSDVWVGRGSVILPGITIGDGAIIGANSVVNRDVPSGQIAAGVPARIIRARDAATPPAETPHG